MGVHKRGVRLRDLIGGGWATPQAVMKDIVLGAGLWAVWMGLMNAHVLGGGTNAARGLLPQGILQSLAWLPLALSAGFCEELAFRGYLQQQFQAIHSEHCVGGSYPSGCLRHWPSIRRGGPGSKNHAVRRPVWATCSIAKELEAGDDRSCVV
jgi:hypothetical protein